MSPWVTMSRRSDAAVLAGHLLPRRTALVIAEADRAPGLGLGEEDAPAVVRHADIVEVRPALRVHADRGAEVDVLGLETERPHVLPPLEELGLPVLERALEPPVLREVDVVGDPLRVVDAGHQTLLRSNSRALARAVYLEGALGPTAFGRWKIQFCHAERRAKILLSRVSGPPNRSDASMPVSASGESARALLERDAHLVLPVDVVGREGHQTGFHRRRRVEILAEAPLEIIGARGLFEEAAGQPARGR